MLMKKIYQTCVLSILCLASLPALAGTIQMLPLPSLSLPLPPAFSVTRQVAVYTPPGYNALDTAITYPVLYVLHRFFGSPTDLQNYYKDLLDEMINAQEIVPMIVVMPDGSYLPYFNGFYTNQTVVFDIGSFIMNWETYITSDVITFIDANFNTKTTKEFRAISGFEVGGYGAVRLGMLNSTLYQAFSSLSGAGLNNQIVLDQLLNMFKIGTIQLATPNTDPSIETVPPLALPSLTSKLIASPFNPDHIDSFSLFPLFMMFAASVAWSPLPPVTTNPGYFVFIPDFTIFGLLNLPYDGDYNYDPTITSGWDIFNPTIMLASHIATLKTQNIWLGYGVLNTYFSSRLQSTFAREPDTLSFSGALTRVNVLHTLRQFNNSSWSPGLVFPTTGSAIGLRDQLKFHSQIFASF
jgi:S-formylglutathione hydrolase FrmB